MSPTIPSRGSPRRRWQQLSLPLTVLAALLLTTSPAPVLAATDVCNYSGGYAARFPGSSCPSSAPVACGVGYQARCCPSGWECRQTDTAFCCPEGVNCVSDVTAAPQCPEDAGWSLWDLEGQQGWCCGAGYFGYSVDDGAGAGCLRYAEGFNDDSSSTASSVTVTKPASCSTTSTSSSSSTTSSTTSSSVPATTTTGSTSATQLTTSGSGGAAMETSGSSGSSGADEDTSSGLSGGAIAGVVIGCLAGLALVLAAVWFVWSRKRKAAAAGGDGATTSGYDASSSAAGDATAAWAQQQQYQQHQQQQQPMMQQQGYGHQGPYTPATYTDSMTNVGADGSVAGGVAGVAGHQEYYKPAVVPGSPAELPTREYVHELDGGFGRTEMDGTPRLG